MKMIKAVPCYGNTPLTEVEIPNFPIPPVTSGGISLLDYYAGQALIGTLCNYTTKKCGITPSCVARGCFDYAEAMIREKAKRGISP